MVAEFIEAARSSEEVQLARIVVDARTLPIVVVHAVGALPIVVVDADGKHS